MEEFKLPRPVGQYEIRNIRGQFVGQVDFAIPELKIAIEVDGRSIHSRMSSFDKERKRASEIGAAGWRLLVFTARHLRQGKDGVVQIFRDAMAAAPAAQGRLEAREPMPSYAA